MLTRRRILSLIPLAAGAAVVARRASASPAAGPGLRVAVRDPGLGAIVAAEGGALVEVVIDSSVSSTQIRIGEADPVDVATKLRLKGSGDARTRFLDDPRNATRVGSAIRDALAAVLPEQQATFAENHRAWARPFARKALAWTRKLQKSPVVGRNVRDEHGRVYLLEWAGAVVDPRGQRAPAALARLPEGPDDASLAAYERYVDALVAALV